MPYSTHDDLKELHEDIDELTSKIADLSFSGTGPNDLIPQITPERNIVATSDVIGFYIQIQALGIAIDEFRWSDQGHPADWVGDHIKIIGDIHYLNHGIGIRFNRSFGHDVGDHWTFTLNTPNSDEERIMAYNWVNDRLKQHITTPIADPSQTIVLAEANYAISLILRSTKREGTLDFRNEAARLIDEMLERPTAPSEIITEQTVV